MFGESGSGAAAAAAVAAAAGIKAAGEAPSFALEPQMKPEAPRTSGSGVPADVASDLGDAGGGLDFKLDEEISISPSSGAKAKSPMDILEGAESELERTARSSASSTMSALASAGDRAKATAGGMGLGFGKIDVDKPAAFAPEMDFTLDASERTAPLRPAAPRPEPTMAGAAASASGAAPSLARPQAAIDLDKLDLSFDPERSTFEDPTPSVLDGQWHDAATKLDLAKAYQEMGDVEGAREILQEVLHEGDDQQKSEAQSLLSKLG
jgi:pilus assembly protein FimV